MKRIGLPLFVITFLVASTASLQAQSESAEHLHEMAVEMAWAADPVTFPYSLRAAFVDGRMTLAGTVSTQKARDRAILDAQHATTLPVADRIDIDPTLRVRRDTVAAEKLLEAASDALRKALPQECLNIAISLQGNGHITLTGRIGSRKSQYEATTALRAVPGIRSIRNELDLGTTVAANVAKGTPSAKGTLPAGIRVVSGVAAEPAYSVPAELELAIRKQTGYRGELVLQPDAMGRVEIQLSAATEAEANTLGKQVMDLDVLRAHPVFVVVRIAP